METNSYSRITENVLFTVLVATVIGYAAASVATNPLPATSSTAVVMAATGGSHS
jgi:hypothetical protein